MSNDAAIVEVDANNVATYRASSLYSCFNALLMARLGYDGSDAPAWLQERFNAGHDHEPLILAKLANKFGFYMPEESQQEEVVIPVGSTARILGHVDGLHVHQFEFPMEVTHMNGEPLHRNVDLATGSIVVVDAKALAVSSFERWASKRFAEFPYYAWQQRAYMIATNAVGLVMAVKNKNTDELRVEYFDEPYMDALVTKAELISKVLRVERAAKKGPAAIFETDCTPMFPCPYFFMHPQVQRDEKAQLEAGEAHELGTLLMAARAMEKQAKGEVERITARILELAGGEPSTTRTPDFTLTTYHAGTSTTDWGAIAAAAGLGGESAAKEKFQTKQPSKNLSVRLTPKKDKKT